MPTLRSFGVIAAVFLVIANGSLRAQRGGAPLAPPREMAELLTTLQDKALTLRNEQGLIRKVFLGTVEVLEVLDVSLNPPVDRIMDSVGFLEPSKRVMVAVGGDSPIPYYLAFETTDIAKASTLKKGDKVTLSGQLVKFVQHKVGYGDKTDKWAVFDNVVFLTK